MLNKFHQSMLKCILLHAQPLTFTACSTPCSIKALNHFNMWPGTGGSGNWTTNPGVWRQLPYQVSPSGPSFDRLNTVQMIFISQKVSVLFLNRFNSTLCKYKVRNYTLLCDSIIFKASLTLCSLILWPTLFWNFVWNINWCLYYFKQNILADAVVY